MLDVPTGYDTNKSFRLIFFHIVPLFAGHKTAGNYLTADGAYHYSTGATVTGQNIWKIIQDDCIAQ